MDLYEEIFGETFAEFSHRQYSNYVSDKRIGQVIEATFLGQGKLSPNCILGSPRVTAENNQFEGHRFLFKCQYISQGEPLYLCITKPGPAPCLEHQLSDIIFVE